MEIKLLKLKNGEDLISQIVESVEDSKLYVRLREPVRIVIIPQQPGYQPQIGMVKWVPLANTNEFEILKNEVLLITDPNDELKNGYSQQFGSGIVTAPPGLIV